MSTQLNEARAATDAKNAKEAFVERIGCDGWRVTQLGECIVSYQKSTAASDEQLCLAVLNWLDGVKHVGEHASGRRYTRLQLIENSLSSAGVLLTARDFSPWFQRVAQDWRPHELLPYALQDQRLLNYEARIEQLEHELHQMEVKANRARAEVNFVVAERDQFIPRNTAEIHQLITQDYENSASWRITKPLRRVMNVWREWKALWLTRRSQVSQRRNVTALPSHASQPQPTQADAVNQQLKESPKWAITAAPWNQPGYTTEAAWRTVKTDDFDKNDYKEWLHRYENNSNLHAEAMQKQISSWTKKSVISVLMPLDMPDIDWLSQAVASVRSQLYPHWELVIDGAKQAPPQVQTLLDSWAATDARIKLVKYNTGLSSAPERSLQRAFEQAKGDWIVFQNDIDLIANNALFILALTINKHKNWRIIYSDSDKLITHSSEKTVPERSQPNFKPDWNVDLFLSKNYVANLCAFDATLVKQADGLDSELSFRKADVIVFDLILRCLPKLAARQIGHIPHVLYHEREASLLENDKLVGTHEARLLENMTLRKTALEAHFLHMQQAEKVHVLEHGLRVQYALPREMPWVTVIIPSKNNHQLLRQCITSLLTKTSYTHYDVIVVDNGSDTSETLDYLKFLHTEPQIRPIRVLRDNDAFNYSALNNNAVEQAGGDIIALMNDDIEVLSADWLTEMVSHALRDGVGAVGARLWYPDKTLQHAGMVLVGGVARHVHKHLPHNQPGYCDRAIVTQSFTAVTGACLVVKKTLYQQVGGLNNKELAIGFNDVDFCLKLVEAGYRNVWTPYAELSHHESATRGQDDSPDKQRRAEKELRYMRRRWGDMMVVDPAYNPNLTDGHDDFSLAWPPRVKSFAQ